MRLSPASIVLGCLLFLPAADAPPEEARTLLDRAIEAHGGKARIARTKVGRIKAKMEGDFPGTGAVKATWQGVFDLPDRYRWTMEGTGRGGTSREEYAVNGMKGWLRQGETPPQDFPVREALPVENHWHAFLSQLLRLRDKNIRLTPLGEDRQKGRTLVGIRAVSPQASVDLFFDKATGLMARARRPMPNLMGKGEIIGEMSYDDYRTVRGVRYPMHIRSTDGTGHYIDLTIISIDFIDKIEDSAFSKPASPSAPENNPPATGGEETRPDGNATASPVRWDARLIAATLVGGLGVGAVWLLVRISRRRKREAPAP